MEQMGYKVKDLAWEMLKYVEISYKQKNGKIRTTIAERGFILEKLKADITREMKALKKYDELTIEMMVDTAIEENSFDNLPQSIRDKYKIIFAIMTLQKKEKKKQKLLLEQKLEI